MQSMQMESNVEFDCGQMAGELGISEAQIAKTVELLNLGNTVFYLGRFARHLTGSLDEMPIREIQQRLLGFRALADRKSAILKTLGNRDRTSPELERRIREAPSMRVLEDLYAPAKSKKRTKASTAIGRGLQPLADEIQNGIGSADELPTRAAEFINAEREIATANEAIDGALDIIAQRMSEQIDLREALRRTLRERGQLVASRLENRLADGESIVETGGREGERPTDVEDHADSDRDGETAAAAGQPPPDVEVPPAAVEPAPESGQTETPEQRRERRRELRRRRRLKLEGSFKDSFGFKELISKIRPHQWLKLDRGERVLVLQLKIDIEQKAIDAACRSLLVPADHPHRERLSACAGRAIWELAYPAVFRQLKQELVQEASLKTAERLVGRWQRTLLQSPLQQPLLAIHPTPLGNYAVAALDKAGVLLERDRIAVNGTSDQVQQARGRLVELIKKHNLTVIAIGISGGGREAEHLIGQWLEEEFPEGNVAYALVNSSGTDEYAISPLGNEELPDLDRDARRAVAVGRRLIDPLGEFVKADPFCMDFGFDHSDIKLEEFAELFEYTTRWCVNRIGIDANRAGPALLRFVSGLDQFTARRLIDQRTEEGPFQSREQLAKTVDLDPAIVKQATGFLRVIDGSQPLDRFAIHPEDYEAATKLISHLGAVADDLCHDSATAKAPETENSADGSAAAKLVVDSPVSPVDLRQRLSDLDPRNVAEELDIEVQRLEQLVEAMLDGTLDRQQCGRTDQCPRTPAPPLRHSLPKLAELAAGTMLLGRVVNIVKFGVFVDIGLAENGLVHISRLANQYVADPRDIVDVGQPLDVWVVDVDREKRRVGLTAIEPGSEKKPRQESQERFCGPGGRGDPRQRKASVGSRRKRPPRGGPTPSGGQRKRLQREKKPKTPLKPLTDEMKSGRAPLRTFGDLKQFFEPDKSNDPPPTDVEQENESDSE